MDASTLTPVPPAPEFKFLLHKDLKHMSITFFAVQGGYSIFYRVRAAELEFAGSREFPPEETLMQTIVATTAQAEQELALAVEAQKDAHLQAGGRVQ